VFLLGEKKNVTMPQPLCDEAAKVKALKKLKDGPGSEINSWRPSEDATAEKIIQGKSGKCQKKTKKSTPSGAKELQKKVK